VCAGRALQKPTRHRSPNRATKSRFAQQTTRMPRGATALTRTTSSCGGTYLRTTDQPDPFQWSSSEERAYRDLATLPMVWNRRSSCGVSIRGSLRELLLDHRIDFGGRHEDCYCRGDPGSWCLPLLDTRSCASRSRISASRSSSFGGVSSSSTAPALRRSAAALSR